MQMLYEHISAFDKVSNQIEAAISGVHEIITRCTYKKICNCSEGLKFDRAPNKKTVIKKSLYTTGI